MPGNHDKSEIKINRTSRIMLFVVTVSLLAGCVISMPPSSGVQYQKGGLVALGVEKTWLGKNMTVRFDSFGQAHYTDAPLPDFTVKLDMEGELIPISRLNKNILREHNAEEVEDRAGKFEPPAYQRFINVSLYQINGYFFKFEGEQLTGFWVCKDIFDASIGCGGHPVIGRADGSAYYPYPLSPEQFVDIFGKPDMTCHKGVHADSPKYMPCGVRVKPWGYTFEETDIDAATFKNRLSGKRGFWSDISYDRMLKFIRIDKKPLNRHFFTKLEDVEYAIPEGRREVVVEYYGLHGKDDEYYIHVLNDYFMFDVDAIKGHAYYPNTQVDGGVITMWIEDSDGNIVSDKQKKVAASCRIKRINYGEKC